MSNDAEAALEPAAGEDFEVSACLVEKMDRRFGRGLNLRKKSKEYRSKPKTPLESMRVDWGSSGNPATY